MAFENGAYVCSAQISRVVQPDIFFFFSPPGSSLTGRVKPGETLSWWREGRFCIWTKEIVVGGKIMAIH